MDWITELQTQLERHHDVVILLEDAGELPVVDVSYDSEMDRVVIQVVPPE